MQNDKMEQAYFPKNCRLANVLLDDDHGVILCSASDAVVINV